MNRPHKWVQSTLGHGETMCVDCYGTNRELAALGELDNCDRAPEPQETEPVAPARTINPSSL